MPDVHRGESQILLSNPASAGRIKSPWGIFLKVMTNAKIQMTCLLQAGKSITNIKI
jgi:hypothetical protein